MERIKKELNLSAITLGTMRFKDKNLQKKDVVNLIEKAYDIGIDTHHSSFEYDSYDLYLEALKAANCKLEIRHIVKIAAPHFEDKRFSISLLQERVENQLKELNIECIDVLQWLVRSKPINDSARLQILTTFKDEINECLLDLKKEGKVKSVFSFPYSLNFSKEIIGFKQVDGIISYLNTQEREYSKLANKLPFIAIRPLFSGRLVEKSNQKRSVIENIKFVQNHSQVLTQIISINKPSQLDSFIDFNKKKNLLNK